MPKVGLGYRNRLRGDLAPAGQEIDLTHQALVAWREVEHDIDGHHTTLTATSATVAGAMSFGGPWGTAADAVLTPPQLTANTNNYNPTDMAIAQILRLSTDAARDLTGIVTDSAVDRWLALFNVGNFNLVLKHNSVNSLAVYRFGCPNGADLTLNSGDSVWLWYDHRAGNWRVMGV